MDKDVLLVLMPVSSINDCTLQSETAGEIHWSVSGEFYQSGSEIYVTVKCILQNHYNINNVTQLEKKRNLNEDGTNETTDDLESLDWPNFIL